MHFGFVRLLRLGATHLRLTLRPVVFRSTVNVVVAAAESLYDTLVPIGGRRVLAVVTLDPRLAALNVVGVRENLVRLGFGLGVGDGGGGQFGGQPGVGGVKVIVAWTPTDAGPYELQIRNLGGATNVVEAVFKGAGGTER